MFICVDSEEYYPDFIRSCKRLHFFKKEENRDPGVSIHCGKCKFPAPIAYQACTRLRQIVSLIGAYCIVSITVPHRSKLTHWSCTVV